MTITIDNPNTNKVKAVFLKAHLRMLSVGMKNSQFSGKDILTAASQISGKKYKRGAYKDALKDMQSVIDAAQ